MAPHPSSGSGGQADPKPAHRTVRPRIIPRHSCPARRPARAQAPSDKGVLVALGAESTLPLLHYGLDQFAKNLLHLIEREGSKRL